MFAPSDMRPKLSKARRVELPPNGVVEPMAKTFEVEFVVCSERPANGLVVPIPTLPPMKVATGPAPACDTASVGYALDEEAKSPACAHSAVVVALVTVEPKFVVVVNGNAPSPCEAQAEPVLVIFPVVSA